MSDSIEPLELESFSKWLRGERTNFYVWRNSRIEPVTPTGTITVTINTDANGHRQGDAMVSMGTPTNEQIDTKQSQNDHNDMIKKHLAELAKIKEPDQILVVKQQEHLPRVQVPTETPKPKNWLDRKLC